MAQIPNLNAATVSDGLLTYLNVDTVNKVVQLLNGVPLKFYSDGGVTLAGQIVGGTFAPAQSATAMAIATGNTIVTAGVGVARVAPAAAVTGVILAAGTIPGQECWVVNEAAAANTVTFAAAGTSNVADGAGTVLAGLVARKFVWDGSVSLWFRAA